MVWAQQETAPVLRSALGTLVVLVSQLPGSQASSHKPHSLPHHFRPMVQSLALAKNRADLIPGRP